MTSRGGWRAQALGGGYALVLLLAVAVGYLIVKGGLFLAIAGAMGTAAAGAAAFRALGARAVPIWLAFSPLAFPFLRYPSQHAVVTFDRLWAAGLLAAMLFGGLNLPRDRNVRRLVWAFIAFVAIMGIRALATSPDRQIAIESWIDALLIPLVLMLGAQQYLRSESTRRAAIAAFVVAGLILGLLGIAERALGFELATRSGGAQTVAADVGTRVSGPYATDDALAMALLVCLAVTLLWVQLDVRRRLTVGTAVIAIEIAGLTFTFFRGAWISAVVVVVVSLGLRPKRYGRLIAVTGLVGIVVALAFLQAKDVQGVQQRISNTQNVSGRFATYSQAFDLFSHHPLAGVGLGRFAAAQASELPVTAVQGVNAVQTAHSSFMDVLAEGGIFAFAAFLWLLVSAGLVIRATSRRRRNRTAILYAATATAAGLAYLLMSAEETVITSSTASNAFLAVLTGLLCGYLAIPAPEAASPVTTGESSARALLRQGTDQPAAVT